MRVLFVCTGNKYRSPLAEKMWHNLRPGDRTDSAGTSEASFDKHVSPRLWQEFAKSRGIDLSAHRSSGLLVFMLNSYSLIVGMQPSHVTTMRRLTREHIGNPIRLGPVINLGEVIGLKKIADPAFSTPGGWPQIADQMGRALKVLAQRFEDVP